MDHTLGDAPVEKQYRDQMRVMAQFIDEFFNGPKPKENPQVGFCLMVFNFGDGPRRCNYMSNAQRSDVVTLLKEQLKRFEGQPEIKGRA